MTQGRAVDEQFALYLRTEHPDHLAAVFEAVKPELMAASRRAGLDEQGAEDVLQETFLGVLKAQKRFDPDKPFTPWVRGIALRQINAERRRRARLQGLFLPADARPEEAEGDVPGSDPTEVRRQVEEALQSLGERNRQVVQAALFDGLSIEELSERFHLTKSATSVRLHRGLAQLRERLGSPANLGLLGFLPARWRMAFRETVSVKSVAAVAAVGLLAIVGVRFALTDGSEPDAMDATQDADVAELERTVTPAEPAVDEAAANEATVAEADATPSGVAAEAIEGEASTRAPSAVQIAGVVLQSGGVPAPAGVEVFVLQTTPTFVLPTAQLVPAATTDAEGRFALASTALGDDPTPLLMVRYGALVGWTDVEAADIEAGAFPPMELAPEARIEARVVDVNGLPVEGASLAGFTQYQRFMAPVSDMARQFGFLAVKPYRHLFGGRTDDQGIGSIGHLFGAEKSQMIFFLSVSKEGYATTMPAFRAAGNEPLQADVTLQRVDSLSCSGRVVDEEGAPLPQASSRFLVRGEATTGNTAAVPIESSAEWSVPSTLLDEYPFVLRFECDGYCAEEIAIEESESLSDEPYVITLKAESPFEVHVRDEAGQPLAGVELTMATTGAIRKVMTDENGSYRFRGLQRGNRRITARYGAKDGEQRSIAVSVGYERSEAYVVLPEVARRVERLELSTPDGSGWKFVDLLAVDVNGFVGSLAPAQLTGELASFKAVPEGRWIFSGLTLSGEPCTARLQLAPESGAGPLLVEALPVPTGMARCLLSPTTGSMDGPIDLEDCTVNLRRTDLPSAPRWLRGGRRVAVTGVNRKWDPTSVVTFKDLSVGQWCLAIHGNGWASAPMSFEVQADEVTRLDVEPVPAGTLSFLHPPVDNSGVGRFYFRRESSEEWQPLGFAPFGQDPLKPSIVVVPEGEWQWRATLKAPSRQGHYTDVYPATYGTVNVTANSKTTIEIATAAIAPPE